MNLPRLAFYKAWLVAVATLSICLTNTALAKIVQKDHIEVELITDHLVLTPGQEFNLGLRLSAEDGWHTYWKNPGDAGLATDISFVLPSAFEVGGIQWPYPHRFKLGDLVNYGYEGEVVLPIPAKVITDQYGAFTILADASWLVCKDICIPGNASLSISLKIGEGAIQSGWFGVIAGEFDKVPSQSTSQKFVSQIDSGGRWALMLGNHSGISRAEFFPEEADLINAGVPQALTVSPDGAVLSGILSDFYEGKKLFSGTLVVDGNDLALAKAYDISLQPVVVDHLAFPDSLPANNSVELGLLAVVLMGFLGGIILNAMPCVFPILALKVTSMMSSHSEVTGRRQLDSLLFAVGVFVAFWVLGAALIILQTLGHQVGWGFQLQSPTFVFILAILFFVISLNMAGLFEIGMRLQSIGSGYRKSNTAVSSFLSGVLAVVVATPCTAPFMGAAMGFSLTQSTWVSALVFTSLAAGMAFPYVLITSTPQIARLFPKPGAWMLSFKHVLSVPLFLTVLWLVWVFGKQTNVDAVLGLLISLASLGFALWFFGKIQLSLHKNSRGWQFLIVVFVLVCLSSAVFTYGTTQKDSTAVEDEEFSLWNKWSVEGEREALRSGKPVFIDFTAAWCITCQVNERVVLGRDIVEQTFLQHEVVLLKADWTSRDPVIAKELQRYGRTGIPLYVFYPAGVTTPVILTEILSVKEVMELFDQ